VTDCKNGLCGKLQNNRDYYIYWSNKCTFCNKTLVQMSHTKTLKITAMFRSLDDHHQRAFWSWLKLLVKIWVFKCGYAAAYVHSFCMLHCVERHVNMSLRILAAGWPFWFTPHFLRCASTFWSIVSQHFHHLTLHNMPLFRSFPCCENPKLNFLRHPNQLTSDITHYKNQKFGMGNKFSVQWQCIKPFCICCVHSSPINRYFWD
jgi:hypothetical protein